MLSQLSSSRRSEVSRAASKSSVALGLILRIGDPLALIAGAMLASWLRFGQFTLFRENLRVLVFTLLCTLVVLGGSSLYRSWRGRGLFAELFKLMMLWTIVFAIMVVYTAALQLTDELSRLWLAGWFGMSLTLAVGLRVFVRGVASWVRAQGLDLRRAVVIGANPDAQRIVDTLAAQPWMGIRVDGWFATPADRGELQGVNLLDGLGALAEHVEAHGIDQVWISLPMREQTLIAQVLAQLEHSTAEVKLLPDLFGMQLLNHSVEQVGGLPVLNLRSSPLDGAAHFIKAAMDRVLAASILLLIAPLLVLIAIGVKLSSPGPIVFRQLRHGIGGKPIEVWKFRSMQVHEEHGEVMQATRNDPRVTRFGAFLRRTSLDELPQFFNVLQGSMSVVGPRPHAIAHNERYKTLVDRYMQRHRVKPGITGWAQVNGLRGETDTVDKMARRVEYDLHYLQNWSPWLDLKIIVMTVVKGFTGSTAY